MESGLKVIEKCDPELLITDIEFPDGTAFEMLNQLQHFAFDIIFVTAHSEYAIKAFKISAIDYLLKPIEIDELVAAVKKAEHEISNQSMEERIKALLSNITPGGWQEKKIVLTYNHVFHIIEISDIVFCQAEVNNTNFYLRDGRILLSSKNIKEYDDMLTDQGFFKTNRQYLINLKYIVYFDKTYDGTIRMSNGFEIPIAGRRKDILVELVSNL